MTFPRLRSKVVGKGQDQEPPDAREGTSLPGSHPLSSLPQGLMPEEAKSFSDPLIPPRMHKLTKV